MKLSEKFQPWHNETIMSLFYFKLKRKKSVESTQNISIRNITGD